MKDYIDEVLNVRRGVDEMIEVECEETESESEITMEKVELLSNE